MVGLNQLHQLWVVVVDATDSFDALLTFESFKNIIRNGHLI